MIIACVSVRVKEECVDAFLEATLANARQSLHEPGIARFDGAGPLGGGARTGADAVEVLEPSPREEVEPRPQRQGGEEREGEEDGARGEARRRRERADEGLLPRVHVRVREVGHRRHGRALRGDGLRGAHRRPRGARDDGVMYE